MPNTSGVTSTAAKKPIYLRSSKMMLKIQFVTMQASTHTRPTLFAFRFWIYGGDDVSGDDFAVFEDVEYSRRVSIDQHLKIGRRFGWARQTGGCTH